MNKVTTACHHSSQEEYGCNELYQWHTLSRGPAKDVTLSVSQEWGIFQFIILSNLSMLGKETHVYLQFYVCLLRCNNIFLNANSFDFYVVWCITEYVTVSPLCMHHSCCIHSCCLCLLLADWILKWIIHIPCDCQHWFIFSRLCKIKRSKCHVNIFDLYNGFLKRCGYEVHHQKGADEAFM